MIFSHNDRHAARCWANVNALTQGMDVDEQEALIDSDEFAFSSEVETYKDDHDLTYSELADFILGQPLGFHVEQEG